MPTPNYQVGPTPPPNPPNERIGLEYWFDTTNSALNAWTTTNAATGRTGWLPISLPAVAANLNASAIPVGVGQLAYIPVVLGSLGASFPNAPVGMVGVCYDLTNNQLNVVASGGATIRRSPSGNFV